MINYTLGRGYVSDLLYFQHISLCIVIAYGQCSAHYEVLAAQRRISRFRQICLLTMHGMVFGRPWVFRYRLLDKTLLVSCDDVILQGFWCLYRCLDVCPYHRKI